MRFSWMRSKTRPTARSINNSLAAPSNLSRRRKKWPILADSNGSLTAALQLLRLPKLDLGEDDPPSC